MNRGALPEVQLERLSRSLRALARRLSVDESTAEDLAQDALVTALEQPPGKIVDLDSWLSRVVRHLAYRQHRRNALRQDAERKARELPGSSEEEVRAKSQALRQLSERILDLPEPYGKVLELRYFEGRSREEIAAQLGRSPEAVKKQIQRGLTRVRANMERSKQRTALDWGFLLLPMEISPSSPAGDDFDVETWIDSKGGSALTWSASSLGGIVLLLSAAILWLVMTVWRDAAESDSEFTAFSSPQHSDDRPEAELSSSSDLVAKQPLNGTRTSVPVADSEVDVEAQKELPPFEIRVRVRDKLGEQVSEVEVFALDSNYALLDSALADEDGAVQLELERDSPGLWSEHRGKLLALVYATAPGYAASFTYEVPLPWEHEVPVQLEGPAASLWGVILDEAGEPLPGVEVQAIAGGEAMFLDEVGYYRGPLIHNTTSDEDGFFELLGLQRTTQLVAANLPGYVGGHWQEALGLQAEVECEYVLSRGATVVGTIRDVDGQPLQNARVHVSLPPGEGGGPVGITDVEGRFSIDGVPGEKRWLYVEHPERPLIGDMVSIDLEPAESFEWNTMLKPLDFLDIRVASESGALVPDTVIVAEALNWYRVPTRLEPGLYRLTFLPPPPNVLAVSAHDDLGEGAAPRLLRDLRLENQEIYVELQPPSWGVLELTLVAADGAPLPSARLKINQLDALLTAEVEVEAGQGRVSAKAKPGPCRMTVVCNRGLWELGDFEIEPGVTLELGPLVSPKLRAVPVTAPASNLDGPWVLNVAPELEARRGFEAPLATFDGFPTELSLWPGEYELRSGATRLPILVPGD